MGRALLIAEYYIQTKAKNGKETEDRLYPVYIATSHFESLNDPKYAEIRALQMADTFDLIFKSEQNCMVLGDYNFDNENEYKSNIQEYGFYDVIKKFQEDEFTEEEE